MFSRFIPRVALLLLALLPGVFPHALAQSRSSVQWKLQYFYDEIATELQITSLAFPSATHGVAVGAILDRKAARKPRYTALVSSDGGEHWALVPLQDAPRSLFFLNEANGWMVTRDAFWFTADTGRTWMRLTNQIKPNKKLDDAPEGGLILRVAFLDPRHGFAVGLQKSVYETTDGGRTWTRVAEAAKPSSNPAYTSYTDVAFTGGGRGLVVGGYSPPRRDGGQDLPGWIDPERTLSRRQVPTLTIELETRDGGANWSSSTAPLLGSLIGFSLKGTNGLGVFGYADSFMWPSEVYRFNLLTGKSESVFKQKDRRVTDVAVYSDGSGFLAAVEPPGRLASAPVPGKVRMLSSDDLSNWEEMNVDYRAVASYVTLAGPDRDHVWAATDTGMILQLATRPAK
ncbi:MAG TPA: YCF48-related protein [Bryobacteraceae bacterium]|nr:YCF48-related protein [Bryobacteraceae bacterium]